MRPSPRGGRLIIVPPPSLRTARPLSHPLCRYCNTVRLDACKHERDATTPRGERHESYAITTLVVGITRQRTTRTKNWRTCDTIARDYAGKVVAIAVSGVSPYPQSLRMVKHSWPR